MDETTQTPGANNSSPDNTQNNASEAPVVETPPAENTVGAALEAFSAVGMDQPASPTEIPSGIKPSRSYEGLNETEAQAFRSMSNDAYQLLYPHYLASKKWQEENQTLKQQMEEAKGSSLYEQEGAWTLAPEYQELSQASQRINGEVQFWQQQLQAIEAGNEWTPLLQNPDGSIVIGSPQPATPQARATVMSQMQHAYSLSGRIQDKLESFTGQYKEKHKGFVTNLQNIESRIFKGADSKKLNDAAKTKLSLFPAFTHGQPIVQTLAKALVIIDGLTKMLNAKNVGQINQGIKNGIANAAGPTNSSIQTGNPKGGQKVGQVVDEFRKARMQGLA